ncbi:hypothetical protein O6H91_01G129900 [Diphasiastrum complanatum]|uniref:Uncharacterized protein n=1 Tax=Diphasiastrum complanatum TaxID=34168 RepID=A0ACC2EVX1_DIPCM|nr:hypothetical protein O6H91_01G129900 [Diphasiastrum complanatum]
MMDGSDGLKTGEDEDAAQKEALETMTVMIQGWFFEEEEERQQQKQEQEQEQDDQLSVHSESGAKDFVYEMLTMRKGKVPTQVLIRQFPGRGLSFQLWPAASALCWYLEEIYANAGMWIPCLVTEQQQPRLSVEGPTGITDELESHLNGCAERSIAPRRRLRVLELGSGTGLVGLVAAFLGGEVVLTDLEHVVPNLRHNVGVNLKQIEAFGGVIVTETLRWGIREDVEKLGSFDIVLASDVVYYDTLFDPLLKTLKWLVESTGSQKLVNGVQRTTSMEDVSTVSNGLRPFILLAHVRRWKKDAQFFRMASKYFDVQAAHKYPATAESRKGTVVYRLMSREKP